MFFIQSLLDYMCENVGALTLYLLFFSLIRHVFSNLRLRKYLPPGPVGLPVVGYLPFLGNEPHRDIAKLSHTYGNIFTLQLGVYNVVVLNDWEVVRDALHKDAFLGRPTSSPFTAANNSISFVADNGPVWRDHRRFSLQMLRDLTFGKGSMEERIINEIGYLKTIINAYNGRPFNIKQLLTPSVSNIICHLVFGHRYDYNDPKRRVLDKMIDEMSQVFSVIGVLAMSPIWFSKLVLRVGAVGNKAQFSLAFDMFDKEIESHLKSVNVNHRRDYMSGYLIEMQSRQQKLFNTHFTLKKLQANCLSFFGSGSDTVRTTIEWALLLAVKYSDHQKRIQEEIDSVIGRDRSPSWTDRLLMPFTQAFINESYRYKTPLPLNMMRCSLEDSSILGHFIPKNTKVLANIWAVHNDPKVWDHPDQFKPERFLIDDGKDVIKYDALIPFSAGKRSCVGETLGRVETFLYLVSLLQKYTISTQNDEILTLEERFGFTLQPKHSTILVFQKRV